MTTAFKSELAKNDTSVEQIQVDLMDRIGRYSIGKPKRPSITHDNGFGDLPKREPTTADYASLYYWKTKLEGAEAVRPDLADATAAYRHYLNGKGADREFSYERFVANDESGTIILKNVCEDFERNVSIIGRHRTSFEVTSEVYLITTEGVLFPYPKTENWQKTIGAHPLWVSGTVTGTIIDSLHKRYVAEIILHVEDKYNFNPGQSDIATGAPDSANGVFEVTGLAHAYMNYSSLRRQLSWTVNETDENIKDLKVTESAGQSRSRNRRPADNRRLRNKI